MYSRRVATPGAQRAIAGVSLVERLSVGLYGELWRAQDARRDLRALIVDGKLGGEAAFATALMDDARGAITGLHHRALVGTLSIARDGQRLVVITEPVLGGASVADLLAEARSRGGVLDGRIAAAVARAVVDGLTVVHAAGLAHGAVHPRSVLVDADGAVRLGDVAVGRALSRAAAHGADGLLRGLAGYLAPELALGEAPGPAADVYAVGAMLFAMLTGETPPGSSNLSPAMERLVQRALDTDLHRRFANATELQENLAEALDDDRWELASQLELARWVQGSRVATAANLDEATEDLLASLAGAVQEPIRRPPSIAPGSGDTGETSLPPPHASGGRPGTLDRVLAGLDGDDAHEPSSPGELSDPGDGGDTGDVPYTQVDPTRDLGDPVSQLIAMDRRPSTPAARAGDSGAADVVTIAPARRGSPGRDADRTDSTPLPSPQPDAPGTITRSGEQVLETGRHKLVERAAMDALSDLDDEVAPPPAPALPRRARPAVPDPDPEVPPSLGRRSLGWLWIVVVLALGGVLVWVVKHSNEVNSANQKAHDDDIAAKKAAADKANAEAVAELPDPGAIRVTASQENAAVWLFIGTTPFDSLGLMASGVHELRVEAPGFKSKDVDVGGRDWTTGVDGRHVARVQVTLDPATAKDAPLPAIPPKPDDALGQGAPAGRGMIHVESVQPPKGAEVWLLVGITPQMNLAGIEAGRDYTLRVDKDGFAEVPVHILAEEWRDGGDPKVPLSAAPKKAEIDRDVTLAPIPKGPRR
jgi:serine/threonine protein kinase